MTGSSSETRCSFCAISLRDLADRKMIAGPVGVYICTDCVKLCVDILVEGRTDATLTTIGDNIDIVNKLRTELDVATARVRMLEFEIGMIAKSVARAMPKVRRIHCAWCDIDLADDDAAREHTAICDKHPAVIELRRMKRSPRARRPS